MQRSGTLPRTPALLRASPMQTWWEANRTAWAVPTLIARATTTSDGNYKVNLQWQDGAEEFMPHKGLESNGVTTPLFSSGIRTLREAVSVLWGNQANGTRYYLAADIEDLPPSISLPVTEFLPAACVFDERFEGGVSGVWPTDVAPDRAHCRGLRSNLWFGAKGTAAGMHFDLSNNLFFQADGRKTFRLLPPSAHRALRLHPSWHGSHLAARVQPSDANFAALGGHEVTLDAGDVLFLPSGWFHRVRSVSHSVGLNVWTDSLAKDVWHVLLTDEARFDALLAGCAPSADTSTTMLFRCARACLLALHVELLRHETGVAVSAGARLAEHAAGILTARYSDVRWVETVPAFATSSSSAAIASVTRSCDASLRDEDGLPPLELSSAQRAIVSEYALALGRLDDAGLRSLLLDELVEEISMHAVGIGRNQGGRSDIAPGGAASVESFLRHCLVRRG